MTEWLSDLKSGYCSRTWYLNEEFCCWEAEPGMCVDWHKWSNFAPFSFLFYTYFAVCSHPVGCLYSKVLFAFTSAFLVKSWAPYAAGSGISEIKCILAGFIMKGFLGARTLLLKSVGLPLAIASGLSVGKEGPSVHVAVCAGHVVSRYFRKFETNAGEMREIYSASCAAGVAVAFGSPIGGVLFSLEEMSPNFPQSTMWKSFFCALIATAVLSAINPFRTGQLVLFQVHYDRTWHSFEVIFFIIIGIFGGLYGAFVIKWNLRAQAFRKRYLSQYAIWEVVFLALLTAVVGYFNVFVRVDMTEALGSLFRECNGMKDFNGICNPSESWWVAISLFLAAIIRTFFIVISYGSKVPAGIFVPSMAVGATFGRFVGTLVDMMQRSYPQSSLFSACVSDISCITPGTYAFLGAAAALSGIMHITVSVVVIMFELTGALTYTLPCMIVLGVTKATYAYFEKGGIADRMIWFNGFPFLDNKEEHTFGIPVSHVMVRDVTYIPASGLKLKDVESLISQSTYRGFPIVSDRESRYLAGYIGKREIKFVIDRAKRSRPIDPNALCYFSLSDEPTLYDPSIEHFQIGTSSSSSLDFAKFIDPTPLTVHPRLPLETVMDFFKKLGPRVILVEEKGHLCGLVTVKDVLKYEFKVENAENPRDNTVVGEMERKLWDRTITFAKYMKAGWEGRRTTPDDRDSLELDEQIPLTL
ncbi:putative chloride channel protein UM03490-D [Neolecta irregularis DAH-3]|uniref:Chloride channel protein n=1 Tax=Neolecta irregularis (strain DAH-3) TaxID=1198029 RepID=A0A1U7LKC0_NEOID|nr:putative chloride channel protein UM03490-D [Neolecta irregularis DAH-3]|eukprot:OLL22992.1 putative chloride channel protein UM03490-D [Neolecta irregularis DAH-3]